MTATPVRRAQPPIAKPVPTPRVHHGDTFVDEYAWLSDGKDPETIAYLEAENAYTEAMTAHLAELRERIFTEIKTRTQETDLSVPSRKGDWWYYSRTVAGQQYAIHCRVRYEPGQETPPATEHGEPLPGEHVLLDGNEVAGDSPYFSLGTFAVSPDGRRLAYATDHVGDERFVLRVKDLDTGETLPDEIPNTFYGAAWSLDGSTLFYLTVDAAWRPYRVWRHVVATPVDDDVIVYEEADERFWTAVDLSRSERYLFIESHSKVTSEARFIDAATPFSEPRLVAARRQGVEYSVDHQGERFLILHNDGAENFELASALVSDPGAWTPLVPHRDDTRLLGVDAFADHLVLSFRRDGLTGLRVLSGSGEQEIAFPEPIYTVGPAGNPEYTTRTFRLAYTSLVTPSSIYDCDVVTGELSLRKRQPVLPLDGREYDPTAYEQHREWATAEDGTRVPISLVCPAGTPRDGSAPLVLYGYGSYEASMDPWFSISRLSLVDRGVLFAVAHVRGGGEMGRRWYEDGKLLKKPNTFTDFVACARHVVAAGWTSTDRLVARGASAGGLLMGAVANLAPDALRAVVAEVPFVDPLTSILDPSLPLTVMEWEEWGNPIEDPDVYACMKSYSPYENVSATAYPAILAVTSVHDTRVLFHEPAKWVAKLRATTSGDRQVLLKTQMTAGHGGRSGRYDAWREEAFVLAWILDQVGLAAPAR
jgi:oligopeptidase B